MTNNGQVTPQMSAVSGLLTSAHESTIDVSALVSDEVKDQSSTSSLSEPVDGIRTGAGNVTEYSDSGRKPTVQPDDTNNGDADDGSTAAKGKSRQRVVAALLTAAVFSLYGTAMVVNSSAAKSIPLFLFYASSGRAFGAMIMMFIMWATKNVPSEIRMSR